MPIKDWADDDKPREKLIDKGAESCTIPELIGLLITNGSREKSAVELGIEIMKKADNNLVKFMKMSLKDYQEVSGIGPAKACIIKAAAELGRRIAESSMPDDNVVVNTTYDAFMQMRYLRGITHEEFWIILTNNSGLLISKHKVGTGSGANVIVDMRRLMELVIDKNAARVILCHNHPGQSMKPSQQDIDLTNSIRTMLRFVQVSVVEHIIVCGDKYYSFLENDLL